MLAAVTAVTVPGVVPNFTWVLPRTPRLAPVMMTVWPPVVGPVLGDTVEIVGAAM